MIRATLLGFAFGAIATSASAMTLLNQAKISPSHQKIEQVKIVCEPDGYCFRPKGRRPVARWVYGDGAFSGPGSFTGPGYYGPPRFHSIWWPFGF
jgi:hypothetical protein